MQERNGKLWFEEKELDSIVEEAITICGHPREANGIATDIDSFVHAQFGIWPEPADLPQHIHGATKFYPDGKLEILISQKLVDNAGEHQGTLHRYRTTVAHEAGHALVHRHLYLQETLNLFGRESFSGSLCKEVQLNRGHNYDWKEYQANQIMSRLLMPRRDLVRIVTETRTKGLLKNSEMISAVSEAFIVSVEAVQYRLKALGITHDEKQISMTG